MAFNMGRPIASLPVPSVSGKDEIMKAAREANMLDAARKQREDKESKILAREMAEKNADVERRRIHAALLEAEFEKLKPPSPPPPTPPPDKPAMLVQIYPRNAATNVTTSSGEPLPVPLYNFDQLERMSKRGKAAIASKMLQHCGDELPTINLNTHDDALVDWILNAQVQLANSVGLNVTLKSFGHIVRPTG